MTRMSITAAGLAPVVAAEASATVAGVLLPMATVTWQTCLPVGKMLGDLHVSEVGRAPTRGCMTLLAIAAQAAMPIGRTVAGIADGAGLAIERLAVTLPDGHLLVPAR